MKPEDRLEEAISRLATMIDGGPPIAEKDGNGQLKVLLDELESAAGELGVRHDELRRTTARAEGERRRYREMFHFAPAGYLLTDLNDEIQDANLVASRMLRVEQRRLIGKQLTRFIPAPDRKRFRIQLALLHDGQELHGWSARIEPRDAQPLAVLLDVVPARDPAGRIIGSRLLIREPGKDQGVSARSRRAHDLLQAAPIACLLLDHDWRVQFLNPAASRIMNRAIDMVMGQVLWDVFPEFVPTRFADIGHAVMENGESLEFEEMYTPSRRWLKGVAFPSADGVCVFFQDVTRVRRAQGAEAQLAAIVEATSLGVFSLSPSGVIESWNHGAEQLLGYRAAEIVGRRLDALIPEDRRAELGFVRRRTEKDSHYETKAVHKNGSMVDISVTLSPMRTGSGDLIGYGVIYRDASDRARETEQMKATLKKRSKTAERLRKRNHMKDLLLIAASHDMRGPLTTMIGTALTLRNIHPFEPGSDEATLLERLIVSSEKLDRLLSDLLDLDRITQGHLEIRRASVDIGEIARRVLMDLGCPTESLVVEGGVAVDGDPVLIERIVENLVVNAVKFSEARAEVNVSVLAQTDGVLLVVEDRGPGVPDDLKDTIFEPFARGRTEVAGHGLGLSLVRGFAELHGGHVWVEDRPGGGSSFRVLIARHAPGNSSP